MTQAIEEVEAATKSAGGSVQEYAGNLQVPCSLNSKASMPRLSRKKRRLKELEAEGLTPADASVAQIVRRIGLLEERSKSLTDSAP